MSQNHILEGEQNIDWEGKNDACDEDEAWAEAPDDAWEGEELEDAIDDPKSCQPQANGCRAHAEPTIVNSCRPDKRHESASCYIKPRHNAGISNRYYDGSR